jgi:ABC-type phosphate transport system substrate-binding protein
MLTELVLVAAIFLSTAEAPQARPAIPFRVIAHPSVAASSVSRAELSAIFLRRRRSWRDGTDVRPVEPPARSRVREEFSRAVHGKNVAYVTRYWHRVIFAGRGVPPEELASDAAVLAFVKSHRGAIGYIDGATPLGDGVKILTVTR